ncbi:unnamed protein product [Brassica oleracea var. botrytis]|uniref:(rape) hypothetical protein n=1 Tax=Brassica napus TaxID=3708 RepID=A0A816RXS5_BRANA|nr:unnamed protein product [Brassica napus]
MKLYIALKKKICSALISSILPSVHMSKTCYRPHHQLVFYKYTQSNQVVHSNSAALCSPAAKFAGEY